MSARIQSGELHLQLPALKERLDDIDEMVRMLIAEHNLQYGKHTVGCGLAQHLATRS